MSRRAVGRRRLLGATASGFAGLLAGCATGSTSGGDGAPAAEGTTVDDRTATSTQEAVQVGDQTATSTQEAVRVDAGEALRLPSLDVAGSPGGLVSLIPPGRAVLLSFFATWCPPCEPEMDHLRAVRERYDSTEVAVISITTERDEAAVRQFWTEHRGTWPVVLDPNARGTRRYDVSGIPTIVVSDPKGREVDRLTGLVGESRLVESLDAALGR